MLTRLKVINDDRELLGGGVVSENLYLPIAEQIYSSRGGLVEEASGIRMRLVRHISRPVRDQIYSALGGVFE